MFVTKRNALAADSNPNAKPPVWPLPGFINLVLRAIDVSFRELTFA